MPDAPAFVYAYRYFDLDAALDYVDKPDFYVWYFSPGEEDPPRCERVEDRPKNATAAVVASTDEGFSVGDKLGTFSYAYGKDPIPPPPPPPPPWRGDLTKYLATPNATVFFDGIPRTPLPR